MFDVEEYPSTPLKYGCEFHEGKRPWMVNCDIALPCATQNEISLDDAKTLMSNGCMAVVEGANMPSEVAAMNAFQAGGVLFGPSKAANAGGVAVSGLEMSQNSGRISWGEEELQAHLETIMAKIHDQCLAHGKDGDKVDYIKGANVAGFIKVADAMLAYGVV